jgi:diaminopimelate epimerase
LNNLALALRAQADMKVMFSKMHGCGNDVVVVYDIPHRDIDWQAVSKPLLDRHFGIGGDGLMVIRIHHTSNFEVLMYNPDGSEMGMCGNGIRCVARFIFDRNLIDPSVATINFNVSGREINCSRTQNANMIKVEMGEVSFNPADLPVQSKKEMIRTPIKVDGSSYEVTCVSVGNPHCVVFVADVDRVPLHHLGPYFEKHKIFPERTNVEFVEVVSPEHIKVRVWERGAGATMACGTGACASLAAAYKCQKVISPAVVDLPGGRVKVDWDAANNRLYLEGPALEVYSGETDIAAFLPQE